MGAFFVFGRLLFIISPGPYYSRSQSSLLCGMFRIASSTAFLLIIATALFAQTRKVADDHLFRFRSLPELTEELDASFFAKNRERLIDTLPDSSIVLVFSAPQKLRTNDIQYPFHQDPDFFYFTGIREPNCLLVMFSNPVRIGEKWTREILFVEDKDAKKETWTGKMLGIEGAMERSGMLLVFPNNEFKHISLPLESVQNVYSNNVQAVESDDLEHGGDLSSLIAHAASKLERSELELSHFKGEDLFAWLRQFKQPKELLMMRQSVDITCEAFHTVMDNMSPGMTEYQIEAMIAYVFRASGAEGEAFPSIVAAGENGGIMHYTANEDLLIPGDLVVIDIGAQYEGYAADITRTLPVSGKFSEEQRQVYQVVLDAKKVATRYAKPGYKFWIPHEEAYRTIGKGLIKLGIIKEWGDIGRYFIHGTSHYLGLDVHDTGLYASLKPGQVITVEPGIYIPEGSPCDPKWWNIFVRIEDDILITEGEAEVLSDCIPSEIAEIEALMDGARASNDEEE